MGYLRGSQEKRKGKNSPGDPPTQNHVDRVRLHDASSYEFGGPGRGSGWRQRSLSNIDLTSQSRHSFTKQIRDYSSGLYDLYSRIESRKDYQDNGGYDEKHKSETIYDHIVPTIDPGALGADSCSLRRTRSLAVIREETYNDLQISGVRTRRSQLIPRAKLCNRSFFKNRSKQKYREEDSGSGVDTQTSETRESDDYYANLKKLETEHIQLSTTVWTTDKSDLDSLDSDYFKNSLHQPVNNVFVNGTAVSGQSQATKSPSCQKEQSTKYQVLEIEVHNQNIRQHSVTTTTIDTTVTSSSHSSDTAYSNAQQDEDTADSLQNVEASNFEEIVLHSEKEETSEFSADNSCELNVNFNTLTLTRHHLQSSDFDSATFEKKLKFKEDRKSVVSYDSIYLSSEGSNEHTIVDECIEDPLPEIRVNEQGEFVDVNLVEEREDESNSEVNLDSLYSQINKAKPKIISFEPKNNLTSFSDTSSRGTLERLTFISSTAQQKEFQQIEGKLYSTEPYVGTIVDNQYCSLPDANIGISLRASERIDAKLRLSCNVSDSTSKTTSEEESTNLIYDSISRFGRAHKRLRQRESCEVVVLNQSSEEDSSKDEPSSDVKTTCKVLNLKEQVCVDLPIINYTLNPRFIKNSSVEKTTETSKETVSNNQQKLEEIISIESTKKESTSVSKKQISTTKIETTHTSIESKSEQPTTKKTLPIILKQNELAKTKETSIHEITTTKEATPINSTTTKETFSTKTSTKEFIPTEIISKAEAKEKKILPSTVILGKKQIIVDELAAKANQAIKKENELKHFRKIQPVLQTENKNKDPTEEETVIPPIPPPLPPFVPVLKKSITKLKNTVVVPIKEFTPDKDNHTKPQLPVNPPPQSPVSQKDVLKPPNKLPAFRIPKHQSAVNLLDAKEALRNEFKANLTDTLRKRIAKSREVFNARPIRVTSVDNISKLNANYEINPSLSYKVQYKDKIPTSSKMSRPQVIKMVETKRICSVAPRQSGSVVESPIPQTVVNAEPQPSTPLPPTAVSVMSQIMTPEVKQEFQEKVDSVRCYWSKLIESKAQSQTVDVVDHAPTHNTKQDDTPNYVTSIEDAEITRPNLYQKEKRPAQLNLGENVTSYSPHVEIIELNRGEKQTAVVNSQNFEVQDFDHVRYKVIKSDTFQKNILTHSRKEAQFDGLLQYLQDYSFQELLANNNVVIIEPVRTKIEKVSERTNETLAMNCKITNGSGAKSGDQKNGIKRHFFYHPIRVNKELLDEELPTPDTVRNARKLFEETLRLRTAERMTSARDESVSWKNNNGSSTVVKSSGSHNLRKKALRHLTIDTSYGGVGSGVGSASGGERKWESGSMSSGISSGELSSPCECNDHLDEHQKEMFSSEENICDDELCESYYVSQDVLAKIRECGSSVTYYGGRVVDNKSPEVSPMTKAIMQEIRGKVCGVCQPGNCPHDSDIFPLKHSDDNLGLKFKLVKSNSCSSRLELAGTGLDEEQLRSNQTLMEGIQKRVASSSPDQDAEESVRTIVNRLEIGAIHKKQVPRIIESKCIEKVADQVKTPQQQEQSPLMTVNSQTTILDLTNEPRLKPVADIISQVTVNNHISYMPSTTIKLSSQNMSTSSKAKTDSTPTSVDHTNRSPSSQSTKNNTTITKVGRNRNVDLAFSMSNAKDLHNGGPNIVSAKSTIPKVASTNHIGNYETETSNDTVSQQLNAAKNAKNLRNHIKDTQAMEPPPSMVSTKKTPTNDDSPHHSTTTTTCSVGTEHQQATTPDDRDLNALMAPRLVKWNTLSRFDEKNYVTNDAKLKQKPKYDEIEFEEFEVFDPNNPLNECYDSLNSNPNQ